MLKITGMHGSWAATVKGIDTLPVVHNTFTDWAKKTYTEGGVDKPYMDNGATLERWAKHAAMVAEEDGHHPVGQDPG